MESRVMVMAGGTGGHVFPALAVAQELRERGMDVFWLGTSTGFEAGVVPQAGFRSEWIDVKGLRGSGVGRWLLAPFTLTHAMYQALRVLRRNRPVVVLGMGGFVTGPGGVMARLLGIPLVIHEQNAIPGMTNQWLSRIATRVLEAFPGSFAAQRRALNCGNPVRREIAALPDPEQRMAARRGRPRVLVLGGSQGAQALNEAVPQALAQLQPEERPEVRHQAGARNLEGAQAAYGKAGVKGDLRAFIDDMADSYAWADLVICRAGALTSAELTAAGVGSILVPYPHAVDDHQTRNGAFLVAAGAAEMLPQTELNGASLAARLRPLLREPSRLLSMARAARDLAQPRATETVARVCMEVQGP